MTRSKWLLCAFLLTVSLGREAKANTIVAKTCNSGDMQSAINSAATGDTVTIPSGTCTWTSGVTISGKGITVKGAGSGRIVARTSNTLSLAWHSDDYWADFLARVQRKHTHKWINFTGIPRGRLHLPSGQWYRPLSVQRPRHTELDAGHCYRLHRWNADDGYNQRSSLPSGNLRAIRGR